MLCRVSNQSSKVPLYRFIISLTRNMKPRCHQSPRLSRIWTCLTWSCRPMSMKLKCRILGGYRNSSTARMVICILCQWWLGLQFCSDAFSDCVPLRALSVLSALSMGSAGRNRCMIRVAQNWGESIATKLWPRYAYCPMPSFSFHCFVCSTSFVITFICRKTGLSHHVVISWAIAITGSWPKMF